MSFNFFNPTKVITGEGCVIKNSAEFLKLGKSCLIVTGGSSAKKSGALADVQKAFSDTGIRYVLFDEIEQNPTLLSCVKAGNIAGEEGLEFVLGIGGGSPLDAAKAAAVYAANEMADGLDIFKMNWKNKALPIAAIGTTSGTGSEVTSFSILTKPDGRKKSFGAADTYPTVAFGDARYTMTLPLDFTVSTALDALAHALEAYFNTAANDITDIFALEAVEILCSELKTLKNIKDINEITVRQRGRLYYASILAGYPLSQCGTLYCHNISYYFTEEHDIPHGFACAMTLPDLVARGERYAAERAKKLFDRADTSAKELCALIESLTPEANIKITDDEIERIASDGATTKNFKKTIPDGLDKNDAAELLTRLFG